MGSEKMRGEPTQRSAAEDKKKDPEKQKTGGDGDRPREVTSVAEGCGENAGRGGKLRKNNQGKQQAWQGTGRASA